MTRTLATVAAVSLIAASVAAQSLSIVYDRSITLEVPGATAAYALNATIADASANDGVVRIHGIGVGKTTIVIVTGETTSAISLVVVPPPIVYPPGVLESLAGRGDSGYVEVRGATNPKQVAGVLDLRREHGSDLQHLNVIAANYFDNTFGSRFGVPSLTYELRSERRDLVLGDKIVTHSPLTVFGSQVRGVHVDQGPWSFDAGAASVSAYQGTFLSAHPEYVGGIARRFALPDAHILEANVYYFRNPSDLALTTRNGTLFSVDLRKEVLNRYAYTAEIAASHHAFGAAFEGKYDDERQHASADFRYRPSDLPSLALDAQHGTFGDLSYAAAVTKRLNAAATLTTADYDLPILRQRSVTSTERLIYALSRRVSLNAGTVYSQFDAGGDTPLHLKTLSIPVGVDFAWSRVSAGGEVQPTWDFNGRRADGYGLHAGASRGPAHLTAYYRRDVDLPTLATFFSEVPGLEDALQRAGIYVTDVSQIIQYLRDSAFLLTLGFANDLRFNVAPSRRDAGVTFDVAGPSQRVSMSLFDSTTQMVTGESRLRNATLMYSYRLRNGDEFNGTASIIRLSSGNSSTTNPAISFALHHRFASVPSLMVHRSGRISGHVFVDDDLSGAYAPSKRGLAGVTVSLDDTRRVQTDASGYYSFDDVPARPHQVAVSVPAARPFSFTNDSPRILDTFGPADFGVTFLLGKVYGRVENDARAGVAGVKVRLEGKTGERATSTADDGSYAFENLPDGAYWLSTAPDSYPPGYDLTQVTEDPIVVRGSLSTRFDFFANALRAISGVVSSLDPRTGVLTPVAGVQVSIPELSRVATTNATGRYRFIDLPAGTFTVAIEVPRRYAQQVTLPAEPANLNAVNFTITR